MLLGWLRGRQHVLNLHRFQHGLQVLLVLLLMVQHKRGLVLEHMQAQRQLVFVVLVKELEMVLAYDMNNGVLERDMLHKDVYMHVESSRVVCMQDKIATQLLLRYIRKNHQILRLRPTQQLHIWQPPSLGTRRAISEYLKDYYNIYD